MYKIQSEIDGVKSNAEIMKKYAKMEPKLMPKSVKNRKSEGKGRAENDAEN